MTTSEGPVASGVPTLPVRPCHHLGTGSGLGTVDAEVLCSLAADIKIADVVDAPSWVVSASLPLPIFDRSRPGAHR